MTQPTLRFALFEPWGVAIACLLLMFVSWRIGLRLGARALIRQPAEASGSPLLDEACLAMLGLLLAFSFAVAYGEYSARSAKITEDANALRTLHLHCELLPERWRQELRPLARECVRQRLAPLQPGFDYKDVPPLISAARAMDAQFLAILQRMNQDAAAAPLVADIADAFNAAASCREERLALAMEHVPEAVVLMLVFVAALSSFLLGRSQALARLPRRTTITFIIMVSTIIYVTLDLDQPVRGFIISNQTPIVQLAQALQITP